MAVGIESRKEEMDRNGRKRRKFLKYKQLQKENIFKSK